MPQANYELSPNDGSLTARLESKNQRDDSVPVGRASEATESSFPSNLLLVNRIPDHMTPVIWNAIKSAGGVGLLGTATSHQGMCRLGKHLHISSSVKLEIIKFIKFVSESISRSPLPIKRFAVGGDYGDRTAIGHLKEVKMILYLKDIAPPFHIPQRKFDSNQRPCFYPTVVDLIWIALDSHSKLWRTFAELPNGPLSNTARQSMVTRCQIIQRTHWVEITEPRLGVVIKVIPMTWFTTADDGRPSQNEYKTHLVQHHSNLLLGYLVNNGDGMPGIETTWKHAHEEVRCLMYQNLPYKILDYIRAVKYIFIAVGQDLNNSESYIETMALLSVVPDELQRYSLSSEKLENTGIVWDDILKSFDAVACLKKCLTDLIKPGPSVRQRIDTLSNMVVHDEHDGALDMGKITCYLRQKESHSVIFNTGIKLKPELKSEVEFRSSVLLQRLNSDSKMPFQKVLSEIEVTSSNKRTNMTSYIFWLLLVGAVIFGVHTLRSTTVAEREHMYRNGLLMVAVLTKYVGRVIVEVISKLHKLHGQWYPTLMTIANNVMQTIGQTVKNLTQ